MAKRKATASNAPARSAPATRSSTAQQTTAAPANSEDAEPSRRVTRGMARRDAAAAAAAAAATAATAAAAAAAASAAKNDEIDSEGSDNASDEDDAQQAEELPKPPKTIHDLPQEIWDNILFNLWSPAECAQWDFCDPQWLSSCRLVSKAFYRRSNDAFIKRNFSVLRIQLTANDPATPSTTPDNVAEAMRLMDRLRLDGINRRVERCVTTIVLIAPRVRNITAQALSPAASNQLRIQLHQLRDRCFQLQKLIFLDCSDITPIPPSLIIDNAIRLFALPILRSLTSIAYRGCDFNSRAFSDLVLRNRLSLTHIEYTSVRLHARHWINIFCWLRDNNAPNVVGLTLQGLYVTGANHGGPPPHPVDYSDLRRATGRTVMAFRNPAQNRVGLQVEDFVLGHLGSGSKMKGKFAVELGLNQLIGGRSPARHRAQVTVEAYKARGLIV